MFSGRGRIVRPKLAPATTAQRAPHTTADAPAEAVAVEVEPLNTPAPAKAPDHNTSKPRAKGAHRGKTR